MGIKDAKKVLHHWRKEMGIFSEQEVKVAMLFNFIGDLLDALEKPELICICAKTRLCPVHPKPDTPLEDMPLKPEVKEYCECEVRSYAMNPNPYVHCCLDCTKPIKPTQEDWPKEGDKHWLIYGGGSVVKSWWKNEKTAKGYRDFLGIYRTEAEAIKMRDKIREFVRERA
ncbi:hypothetical protein IID24_02795 [Patescibacteria group bacterium]|nr:hypothetical protein [Patescibacteria group bacterium]